MAEGRLTQVRQADQRLVADVRGELAEAWVSEDPWSAASLAIGRLIPRTEPGVIAWSGPRGEERPVVLNRTPHSFDTPYAQGGGWRSNLAYTLRGREPFAGLAADTEWLLTVSPEDRAKKLKRTADIMFRQMGIHSIMRVTVYRGQDLVAVVGHVRRRGDGGFSARDRTVLQSAAGTLCDGIATLSAVGAGSVPAGDVVAIVSALPCPALLCSARGLVVHANELARLSFPRWPSWLRAFRGAPERLPRWVRAVPLRLGGRKLWLLALAALDVDPDEAPEAPWAALWGLSPRHARVAAHMLRGATDPEVAAAMGLTVESARTYAKEVLRRARVGTRSGLAAAAVACRRGERGSGG